MAEATFNKQKTLVTGKLDFNLSTILVKCYIWGIAVQWTLWKVIRNTSNDLSVVLEKDEEVQLDQACEK